MPENLFSTLREAASGLEDNNFLLTPAGISMTYGKFYELTAKYAHALKSQGIGKGDRVLSKTIKSIESLALYMSCLQRGAVFIPVNPLCTKDDLRYLITDSEPAMVVLDPDEVAGDHIRSETIGPSGSLSMLANDLPPLEDISLSDSSDTAVILYTSGTTGLPKGVMISHRALITNGLALNTTWGFEQSDVLLHALPMFHVHGLFVAMHCAMLSAAKVIFLERFSVSEVIKNLRSSTVFMGVPTYYIRLLSAADFSQNICEGMRLFTSGSAPMTEQTHSLFIERTGHRILERYGMTEAGIITSNPLTGDRIPGSGGFALPGVDMRVRDGMQICKSGEIGVVEVSGDHVFSGYWRKENETSQAFSDDGFLVTGDIGVIDNDGRLRLKGRSTDLIISGGENIYPREIERHLDDVDCIRESAVIGISDEDLGEAVVAVIAPNGSFNESEVRDYIKDKVANFKRPRRYILIDELPRNSMGKVQKSKLRDAYNGQS